MDTIYLLSKLDLVVRWICRLFSKPFQLITSTTSFFWQRQREGGRGPASGGDRDELVRAERVAGLVVALNRVAASLNMPGALGPLRGKEIAKATLIGGISGSESAGLV